MDGQIFACYCFEFPYCVTTIVERLREFELNFDIDQTQILIFITGLK